MKPALILVLLFYAFGCAAHTDPSRFYVLNAITDPQPAGPGERTGVVLGIGPIQLPEYLDRPQIMTRNSENELEYTEFHHWAEPLKDNFSRVLGENLSVLVPTNRIFYFPWRRSAGINFHVAVDVIRFEGTLGGNSLLTVRWTLYGMDEREREQVLAMKKSTFQAAAQGEDYNATVAALNQTLEQFSREVSQTLRAALGTG